MSARLVRMHDKTRKDKSRNQLIQEHKGVAPMNE